MKNQPFIVTFFPIGYFYYETLEFSPATRLANVVFPVPGLPAKTRCKGVSCCICRPSLFLLSFWSCVLVNLRNCCFRVSSPIKSFIAFSMRCKTSSCRTGKCERSITDYVTFLIFNLKPNNKFNKFNSFMQRLREERQRRPPKSP